MGERTGEWRKPSEKLPPVLTEVPMWINGRHMVGYYNGVAWFSRRGILRTPPMHWFERAPAAKACAKCGWALTPGFPCEGCKPAAGVAALDGGQQ